MYCSVSYGGSRAPGLLPEVMLPHYAFWQISEQCIEARPKDSQSRWFSTALKIQMLPTGLARVRKELAEEGPEGHELLDATRASPSSELSVFAERLSRVEPLSHILLWTSVSLEKDIGAAVDLVEMPRLQLRFRLREGPVIRDSGDGDGPKIAFEPKLFCDAYGGTALPRSHPASGDSTAPSKLPSRAAASLPPSKIRVWRGEGVDSSKSHVSLSTVSPAPTHPHYVY